jgi:hypothetical protein
MSIYHPKHPDGNYQTANQVQVFDWPSTISWKTGYDPGDGTLRFGGWFWRYDLTPAGPSSTSVRLTYDWSARSDSVRELIGIPPSVQGDVDGIPKGSHCVKGTADGLV